jgi:hypothetical protein
VKPQGPDKPPATQDTASGGGRGDEPANRGAQAGGAAPDAVRHDAEAQRYLLEIEGHTAFAEYRRVGEAVMFTHTEVPATLEGRGVGGALVAGAIDRVRHDGRQIIPLCPFVLAYMRRHPDTHDLLAPVARATFHATRGPA